LHFAAHCGIRNIFIKIPMKSFYYSKTWNRLMKSKSYVYYKNYVPLLSILISKLQKASMGFTIVDKEYGLIDALLKDKSYKLGLDIQDCPNDIRTMLESKGFSAKKWGTYIIDLDKPEEELWESIKKEARKIIKKTIDSGCTVSQCRSETEFKEYCALLKKSRKKLGFKTPPYFVMLKQWRIMHPENYQVFMVRNSEGRLLAAMGVVHTKDYMQEVAAARNDEKKENQLYPNDLLKWEIIKWGRKEGIKYYDLAGVNPNPEPGSKDENIRKFKEKCGGVYVEGYNFERYVLNTPVKKFIFSIEKMYRKNKRVQEK
jgi:lipid II:glycine glycyltransferase (peptidoglycan interpeptide bridge formation enzyme)